MRKRLFIVGTGTDVGKTYVTGLILKKLRESGKNPAYFKAAMSGNQRDQENRLIPGDALAVRAASGIDQPLEDMCTYIYEQACSPHLAAQIEGNPVRMQTVKACFDALCDKYDYVTVEGAGGILCPLRFDEETLLSEDVIKALGLPCLIVADAGLGAINAVGLTAAYMKTKNIPVKGIILNRFHPGDVMEEDNLKMCEFMTGLRVLACVKYGDEALDVDAKALAALYE